MITRVVHCKVEKYDVYIGRPSIFGNPFKLNAGESRDATLERYRSWLMLPEQAALRERAHRELKNKVLGCWCKPRAGFNGQLLCHGQILAGMVEGVAPETIV